MISRKGTKGTLSSIKSGRSGKEDLNCQLKGAENKKFLGEGDGSKEGGVADDVSAGQLSVFEKKFLLCTERGDVPSVRALLDRHKSNARFNINCRDAVGRSALIVAIENENMELIELLLKNGIEAGDALLHAISEDYVEAVEVLLQHEEKTYVAGKPYSWEAVDHDMAMFTKDVTPLILAAHRDNYEIIKLLLDRGASLPMPHNVRCGCDECLAAVSEDCLRHSRSRINAYRALTSPSLICLSSTDPIQTAFNLSRELARLSSAENEFKLDYTELRVKCEQYAAALLDHTRTSYELEVMLNYDPQGASLEQGERMKLERLKLAIHCKQKTFVAHPNVQQLLSSVWYEGSAGFRRKNMVGQLMDISKMGMMFPVYSIAYMLAPESELGQTMKKPFTKFICHSTAYCFFLMLLIAASQRVEELVLEFIDYYIYNKVMEEDLRAYDRGRLPGLVESTIVLFIMGFVWAEIKQLYEAGIEEYLYDMWNMVDYLSNMLYLTCIGLRVTAWFIVQGELSAGLTANVPREHWDAYDPMLISEGIFGAANIFSFLKMVHIFSVNPHLGPLQISLGRMVFDIIKFFFIYTLVLFAFGCGMNQLLWYYADKDKELCYSGPNGSQNSNYEQSCLIWRRFANLFETSQSLFWASFGLVELENFELAGIKSYTRFWSLLMFGSYSVINVVVLLNLLIAMMSNSYQIISERADVEWKFARSKLWMSYFEDGDTVPPPFNIIPTPKFFKRLVSCQSAHVTSDAKSKELAERENNYRTVMRCLVRRYVTTQQRKMEDQGVTEDDVNEVKQAVTSFRSELFDILRANEFKGVSSAADTLSRKERLRERRLLKDFNIDLVESVMEAFIKDSDRKNNRFSLIRRMTGKRENAKKNWNAIVGAARAKQNPIGKTATASSGSLKELREKVLQEQELPAMRGRRRFVHAARRILHEELYKQRINESENINIPAIEEEAPGTFSPSPTPRSSMIPEDASKDSDVVVDIESSSRRGSAAEATELCKGSVKGMLSSFEDKEPDGKSEKGGDSRRPSIAVSETSADSRRPSVAVSQRSSEERRPSVSAASEKSAAESRRPSVAVSQRSSEERRPSVSPPSERSAAESRRPSVSAVSQRSSEERRPSVSAESEKSAAVSRRPSAAVSEKSQGESPSKRKDKVFPLDDDDEPVTWF